MKKITFLLLGLLFALPVAAQTQKGYVKTRGRLADNGALIPGKRLAGAFVKVRGRQGVRSNAKGDFALPVDRNFYVERAELAGYTVADRDLLSRRYDYSSDCPLVVVMEKPEVLLQERLAVERKLRRTLRKQLNRREAGLDRLREEQHITQARYDSLLRALYEDQSKSEKLVEAMAERYASIDFDQESELNRRISVCILNGDLSRADSLLRIKGDLGENAAALLRTYSLKDAEAEASASRQELLDQSRRLMAHDLEEFAADCYHRYELCRATQRHDSAAYYLKLRATLDTANVQWALDAGDFVREYLADYSTAQAYYECALRNAKTKYGEHHPDVARCYNKMSIVYYRQGRYDEALSNYSLALDIYKSVYGERHSKVADCCNNVGAVYNSQGRYDDALSNFSLALDIYKSVYGERHSKVADCYNNMGTVYNSQGRHNEALSNFSLALDIRKSVYGERHPDVADCYINMGVIYARHGNYAAALQYVQKALSIYEEILPEGGPQIVKIKELIEKIKSLRSEEN